MADQRATAAMTSVGGHHIKEEITETIDSTDIIDTTTNTVMLNSAVADASLNPTSHSAQGDNSTYSWRKDSQELSSTRCQEVITRQDANSTETDANNTEQSGTEMGSAEIGYAETAKTRDRQSVGYKREHSHSPCSQTSPLQSPTSACKAIGCVVESERDLVVNGEALQSSSSDQGEERQPRKRAKLETMEKGEGKGGGNGLFTETPAGPPHSDSLPPSSQDHSTTGHDPSESTAVAISPQSSPPPTATYRGAPQIHTRPTSLDLPTSLQIMASPAIAMPPQRGGEDRFPNSEEERTPDGGTKEFVGHSYHSPLRNNGEMVTPEKQPTPPNTVIGHSFSFQRMFSVDNNAHHHTCSHELGHTENGQVRTMRQNSEPTRELYSVHGRLFDNNGRPIQDGRDARIAML